MYSGQMTGDAAYESEPEVEDDSYVDASQPSAPAAKVNIVPTKGAVRFKRHSLPTRLTSPAPFPFVTTANSSEAKLQAIARSRWNYKIHLLYVRHEHKVRQHRRARRPTRRDDETRSRSREKANADRARPYCPSPTLKRPPSKRPAGVPGSHRAGPLRV